MTNPTTDLAGLQAVITRALNLPEGILTQEQIANWTALLDIVPPIVYTDAPGGNIISIGYIYPSQTSNSENTNLYPVHPFRVYGVGKPDLLVAQNTFYNRQFPCNGNFCIEVLL